MNITLTKEQFYKLLEFEYMKSKKIVDIMSIEGINDKDLLIEQALETSSLSLFFKVLKGCPVYRTDLERKIRAFVK